MSSGLSSGSSGLKMKFLAPGLESLESLLGPAWQIHVDRGSHAGAQVGGAGVDVAILGVQHELATWLCSHTVSNSLDSLTKIEKSAFQFKLKNMKSVNRNFERAFKDPLKLP